MNVCLSGYTANAEFDNPLDIYPGADPVIAFPFSFSLSLSRVPFWFPFSRRMKIWRRRIRFEDSYGGIFSLALEEFTVQIWLFVDSLVPK